MVDEKIAALAAEYEKARKQNVQLREALMAKDRYNHILRRFPTIFADFHYRRSFASC